MKEMHKKINDKLHDDGLEHVLWYGFGEKLNLDLDEELRNGFYWELTSELTSELSWELINNLKKI
jgi:hypothetical protein